LVECIAVASGNLSVCAHLYWKGIRDYMTQTEPNTRRPAHRCTKTALALLTATAALSGGTQALAPTPALAMNNQGNECQNLPTWERTVCELEDAGGSGASGGTAGGSNGSGGAPTIGHETIEIHDTRPSHCQLSPSSCLPSMPGGRHQIGSDGVRPRGPRPGHRPVRVGEVEKGNLTKEECALLQEKIAALEEAQKQAVLRADLARRHLRDARDLRIMTINERSRLGGELDDLLNSIKIMWKGKLILELQKQSGEIQANIKDLEQRIRLSSQDLDQANSARATLVRKRWEDLYRFANGGCRRTD
jgi:hypothetical protein